MRKLGLKLDELSVESFEVSDAPAERGTVVAHETGTQRLCTDGFGTCDYSCGGGCGGYTDGCGTFDCNNTDDYTCATGNQRLCMCG
jgi:hypothetical protein